MLRLISPAFKANVRYSFPKQSILGVNISIRFAQSRAAKSALHETENPVQNETAKPAPPPSSNSEKHPILKRTPKFLHRYFGQVLKAPTSHIISFLILHEATAIIPLVGLWCLFHHYQFLPTGIPDWMLTKGTDFIGSLSEKYQWDFLKGASDGSRIIVEGAAAYSIVKLTMPLRATFSILLMPWFARVFVLPITGIFKRFRKS